MLRRKYLDRVFFWNAADLGRKLEEFKGFVKLPQVVVQWIDEHHSLAVFWRSVSTRDHQLLRWLHFRFSVSYQDIEELMALSQPRTPNAFYRSLV
jgi:hypothetical protein